MKLVMVYNADDGLFNAITDSIHKVFSPSTYECRLCSFTYGLVGMLRTWKQYLESIPMEKTFYHRPAFAKDYPDVKDALPAIYIEEESGLNLLIGADEMNEMETLEEMMDMLSERLTHYKISS